MKNQLIIFFIFFSFSISSQENNFIVGATLNFNELNTKKSNLFLKDFTYLTPANAAKQTIVHPKPNTWNWTKIDQMIDFAKLHNLYLRIHGPIGPQSSKWAKDDLRTSDELMLNLVEFMTESCVKFSKGTLDSLLYLFIIGASALS